MSSPFLRHAQQIIAATIREQQASVAGPPSVDGLAWAITNTLVDHDALFLGGVR